MWALLSSFICCAHSPYLCKGNVSCPCEHLERICRSGSIAPLILNLETECNDLSYPRPPPNRLLVGTEVSVPIGIEVPLPIGTELPVPIVREMPVPIYTKVTVLTGTKVQVTICAEVSVPNVTEVPVTIGTEVLVPFGT
jgi:hypothetical protein